MPYIQNYDVHHSKSVHLIYTLMMYTIVNQYTQYVAEATQYRVNNTVHAMCHHILPV